MGNLPKYVVWVLIIVLGLGGGMVLYKYSETNDTKKTDTQIVQKVGEENIYQKDLDYEMNYYPDVKGMDKIILQAGQKEKLITLDKSIYNSLDKNYEKRLQSIVTIKNQFNKNINYIEGKVITLAFLNNGFIGPQGYEKNKQTALTKITAIRTKVKNKQLTIDQAEDEMKKDKSLKDLDRVYENNISIPFKAVGDQKITVSAELDAQIRKLNEGEMTEIIAIKEKSNPRDEPLRDVAYAFGYLKSKKINGVESTFETWLDEQKKQYDIKIY
jgi:hypothetical protein